MYRQECHARLAAGGRYLSRTTESHIVAKSTTMGHFESLELRDLGPSYGVIFALLSHMKWVRRLALSTLMLVAACQSRSSNPQVLSNRGRTNSEIVVKNNLVFNGLSENGIGVNGLVLNGIQSNGVWTNGVWTNGVWTNGVWTNGVALHGLPLNGIALNGLAVNGVALSGVSLNGVVLNSVALGGLLVNGVALNGSALNGVALSAAALNGVDLKASDKENLKILLRYMAECALMPGSSIAVSDYDAATASTIIHTYEGIDSSLIDSAWDSAIDPGWRDGAPDLSKAGIMGECVMARGQSEGQPVHYQNVNLPAFKKVIKYMIECALSEGDSVTLADESNQPWTINGWLGLAPSWANASLDSQGQRRISACLAARTNALGRTVQISMRGLGLSASTIETRQYQEHEGGFWGNLFSESPSISTCRVAGGGPSGRLCTSEKCGFVDTGACAEVCATQKPDGTFSDCEGESQVINTFLALESRLAAGAQHTCAVDENGLLSCWGFDAYGQLGSGGGRPTRLPRRVDAIGNVADVSANSWNTCARSPHGELWCWGRNSHGEAGNGTTEPIAYPSLVVGPLNGNTAQVDVGDGHSCATHTNGTVWCWGNNPFGQLGDGTTIDRSEPVQVSNLEGLVRVATGEQHSCALGNSGSVWCWGGNNYGQLGDSTLAPQSYPIEVTQAAQSVDLCASTHGTCVLNAHGDVSCWGRNDTGALGASSFSVLDGVVVTHLPMAAKTIACGHHHVCALLADGSAWCWGFNGYGQLGDGSATNRNEAVMALNPSPHRVEELIAGTYHTCAKIDDGSTWCWGGNANKQLGPGIYESPVIRPRPVSLYVEHCGDEVCSAEETPDECPADCDFSDGIHRITALVLVDAATGDAIQTIHSGDELFLDHLPDRLSVRAHTYPSTVGSVRFAFDGDDAYRTESTAPYAIEGDNNGLYSPLILTAGPHTIGATPYLLPSGQGEAGHALSVDVLVRAHSARSEPFVTSFVLVNADDNTDIGPLTDDSTISLSTLPSPNLAIRAETNPSLVGSVRIALDGNGYTNVENGAPYTLWGDIAGNYMPGRLNKGVYTITATPFTQSDTNGTAGLSLTVNIVVVD